MDSKSTESKADRGEKSRDGVEVQQEFIHIGPGMWRSQEVSHYYAGQQFGLSEKKQVRWGTHL